MDFEHVSGQIKTLKRDIERLEGSLNDLEREYRETVPPNVKTWNNTADSYKWLSRIVMGAVVLALLALIGLK